jgi:hypothetical protein
VSVVIRSSYANPACPGKPDGSQVDGARATATVAFLLPTRFTNRVPQAFRDDHFETRLRMIPAASNKYARNNLSPHREIRPV